jgi:hypothetical protein
MQMLQKMKYERKVEARNKEAQAKANKDKDHN